MMWAHRNSLSLSCSNRLFTYFYLQNFQFACCYEHNCCLSSTASIFLTSQNYQVRTSDDGNDYCKNSYCHQESPKLHGDCESTTYAKLQDHEVYLHTLFQNVHIHIHTICVPGINNLGRIGLSNGRRRLSRLHDKLNDLVMCMFMYNT